jgi:hypothetical protein
MGDFTLLFEEKPFPVPKTSLAQFIETNPNLADATSYTVQSAGEGEVFELFANSLKNQTKLEVTEANAAFFLLLAKEFGLAELRTECEAIVPPEAGEAGEAAPPEDVGPPPTSQIICGLAKPKSLDGIIANLTKKYGGNVHEKGAVSITSKSVADSDRVARNVADFLSTPHFGSRTGVGQWICWDFRDRRVRLTHYTMRCWLLKSWVLEGSIDGENWTEVDRQTNNQDFKAGRNWVSYAVATPKVVRFIRLTQTDKNHWNYDSLDLQAVEFFGAILEYK